MRQPATYVLPLRWERRRTADEMTEYLARISRQIDVIVVDGSPPEVFEHHAGLWGSFVKHIPCDSDLRYINGKVNGVTTGIRAAGTDNVIIADDDIRFEDAALERMVDLLADNDLVLTQSYFEPSPWNAMWDEARVLSNRAFGIQFPAALGLRRRLFLEVGGYDGDVLFENLELIRTLRIAGARTATPLDLFVRHLPADATTFWRQRVRQAYDDLAIPGRMALWLSLLPLTAWRVRRKGWMSLATGALAPICVAEVGRRRYGGAAVYRRSIPLIAPLWVFERALCSWVALWFRFGRKGVTYRDGRLLRAATRRKDLRHHLRDISRHDRER
jgi:glycosyltransferase involved in cell wall biosynthesis